MIVYIVTEVDFNGFTNYTIWSDLVDAEKHYHKLKSDNNYMLLVDSLTLDEYEVNTQRSWQLEKVN